MVCPEANSVSQVKDVLTNFRENVQIMMGLGAALLKTPKEFIA